VVVGPVNGSFIDVFKKISALHAKNAFALAIVAGDLFSNPEDSTSEDEANIDTLLSGNVTIPLPTYFALGKHSLPAKVVEKLEENHGELCEHLYFVGKRTTIKTSEGLRVVALGGTLDPNLAVGTSKDKYTPFYSGGDASALKGANTADILLTSEWPFGISLGSKVPMPSDEAQPAAHHVLAELNAALKPRYHFSTSPFFYEREPFFHPAEDNTDANATYPTTRFISLAPFGNANKQKWIYAFTLAPSLDASVTIPPGSTASPFAFASKKRPAAPLPDQSQSFTRFAGAGTHTHSRPHKRGRRNDPPPGPDSCFFCLSNPNLATHLIVSIGTDAYLTTAKGPLTTSSTLAAHAPSLQSPGHILIIPLAHSATLASVPEEAARLATIREMRRYRHALDAMVMEMGKGKLGSVCWEVSRGSGVHAHWQWLPVSKEVIEKGLVEAAMKVEAGNEGWDVAWEKTVLEKEGKEEKDVEGAESGKETTDGSGVDEAKSREAAETAELDILTDPRDAFRVWTWLPSSSPSTTSDNHNGGTTTLLTLPLSASFRFDVQFGRRVLAKLLGLETRRDWRDCGQSEAEEEADAGAFKKAFEKWDWTLEE